MHLEYLGVAILVLSGALVFNGGAGLLLIRTGRRAGSLTLEADGRHLMSDAVTSSFALIAVVLVRLTRLTWIDPVMAQEMMTLRDAMAFAYFAGGSATVLAQKSPMRRSATAGQELRT